MKYILLALMFSSQTLAQSLQEAKKSFPKMHEEIVDLTENDDFLEIEKYSEKLKEIYFLALVESVNELKRTNKIPKDTQLITRILENLEYKEDEVRSLTDELEKHQNLMIAKKWHRSFEASLSYISLQRTVHLHSSQDKYKLINTVSSSCIGGGIHFQNSFWAFNSSGCLMIGSSNIKEEQGIPQYKESNIPLWGVKLTQRLGMVSSSSGPQLGLSLPVFLNFQDLKNPPGHFHIKKDKKLLIAPAVYGKWQMGKYFFETEIGQFLDQSNIFYSLGLGARF